MRHAAVQIQRSLRRSCPWMFLLRVILLHGAQDLSLEADDQVVHVAQHVLQDLVLLLGHGRHGAVGLVGLAFGLSVKTQQPRPPGSATI